MKDDILIGDTPKAVKRRRRLKGVKTSGRLWKHSRITDIYGLVTQAEIDAFCVFMLVRNPFDRVVSYYHWLKTQSFDHPVVGLAQRLGFSEFLNRPEVVESLRASPYASYIRDATGRDACDLFLRLEHLGDDLPELEKRLNTRLPPMTRENTSERSADWRVYFSDADRGLIEDICGEDLARFGYGFDPE